MPPRAKTTQKRENIPAKGEATAERILDATFKLIAEQGCGAVTLRGIAEEANVVLSQLSYYYGNKDRLFSAVLRRMQEGYIAGLDAYLVESNSLSGQIIALVDYNESILKNSPDTYRNFLEFFSFAMSSKAFQKEVSKFTSTISGMIERRIAPFHPEAQNAIGFSAAAVTRFILSASFGIALQTFLSPRNKEAKKGFDIIKVMALSLQF